MAVPATANTISKAALKFEHSDVATSAESGDERLSSKGTPRSTFDEAAGAGKKWEALHLDVEDMKHLVIATRIGTSDDKLFDDLIDILSDALLDNQDKYPKEDLFSWMALLEEMAESEEGVPLPAQTLYPPGVPLPAQTLYPPGIPYTSPQYETVQTITTEGPCGLALGKGSWAKAYRQVQGQRRDALQLLCTSGIVTAREFGDDNTVISEEHIDECVLIATEMLQTWPMDMWARQGADAKKFFEARLTATYQRKFGEHQP